MTHQRRALALAVPTLALALVASACGGGGNGKEKGSGNSDGASSSSAADSSAASAPATSASGTTGGKGSTDESGAKLVDIAATPYDQIKDGGTLTQAIDQMSTQWNFNQVNGPESSTSAVMTPIMPGTYKAKADGTVFLDENYVLSWKVATKPAQVATFELNPKAKWSDGKPVAADDYIAEWKALSGKDKSYQVASSTGYDRVGSVKAGRS